MRGIRKNGDVDGMLSDNCKEGAVGRGKDLLYGAVDRYSKNLGIVSREPPPPRTSIQLLGLTLYDGTSLSSTFSFESPVGPFFCLLCCCH